MPRYLLLQNYEGGAGCDVPMHEWPIEDVRAHIDFQVALNAELTASGELVDALGLAGPDVAKVVLSDGVSVPVVTDGPDLGPRQWLAGYRLVDVVSLDRALEIAARASVAPAAGGRPLQQRIEVREVVGAPEV